MENATQQQVYDGHKILYKQMPSKTYPIRGHSNLSTADFVKETEAQKVVNPYEKTVGSPSNGFAGDSKYDTGLVMGADQTAHRTNMRAAELRREAPFYIFGLVFLFLGFATYFRFRKMVKNRA